MDIRNEPQIWELVKAEFSKTESGQMVIDKAESIASKLELQIASGGGEMIQRQILFDETKDIEYTVQILTVFSVLLQYWKHSLVFVSLLSPLERACLSEFVDAIIAKAEAVEDSGL